MLKSSKELKGDTLFIVLEGALEEHTDFDQIIGITESKLNINCKGIVRINSVGIRAWIEFFNICAQNNIQIVFSDCSPVIVQQMNFIRNFVGTGTVESIMVPFSCEKCHVEFQHSILVEDLVKSRFNLPTFQCPRCQGRLSFDDEPEEYFGCFKHAMD